MNEKVINVDVSEDGIVALNKWIQEVGITPVTAWRWRRAGWLSTINISGRIYITGKARIEFRRRAEAGEFAKVHPIPGKADLQAAA